MIRALIVFLIRKINQTHPSNLTLCSTSHKCRLYKYKCKEYLVVPMSESNSPKCYPVCGQRRTRLVFKLLADSVIRVSDKPLSEVPCMDCGVSPFIGVLLLIELHVPQLYKVHGHVDD